MLNLNRVYNIDCMEGLKQLEDESVDCVVTSPPYNIKTFRRNSGGGRNSCHRKYAAWVDSNWYADNMDEQKYQEWQQRVIRELLRVCPGPVFYNHKIRYGVARTGRCVHPMAWLQEFPLWEEIIWERQGSMAINCRRWAPADERIYMLGRPRKWHGNQAKGTSIWRMNYSKDQSHPCPFPEELVARCIQATTDPGDLVLDPFCGIGTVCFVAKKLGRCYMGFDNCKAFVDEAELRLESLAFVPRCNRA